MSKYDTARELTLKAIDQGYILKPYLGSINDDNDRNDKSEKLAISVAKNVATFYNTIVDNIKF